MGQSKILGFWVVAMVCCVAFAALTHNGAVSAERMTRQPPNEVSLEYLPSVDSVPFLSLGHRAALADLYWIRGVLYFYNEISHYQDFTWLQQYIHLIKRLDPDFVDVYRWAGTVLVFSKKTITLSDVQQANVFLEEGAERFPSNYELPLSAAANCSYYVKNPSPEEKASLAACRRKFLAMAVKRPDVPQYVILLHAQLMQEEDADSPKARQQLCDFLLNSYMSQNDRELQKQIERRMAKSGFCNVSGEQLSEMRDRFERLHERTYAYLPEGLALQVADFGALVGEEGVGGQDLGVMP